MNNRKILVVDDEDSIRNLFGEIFKEQGYKVFLACDGTAALNILSKNDIHVMFLDINMPGMNGIELCQKIREINPGAYICAVTGYVDAFDPDECRGAGFDDFFSKPVELANLIEAAECGFSKFKNAGYA